MLVFRFVSCFNFFFIYTYFLQTLGPKIGKGGFGTVYQGTKYAVQLHRLTKNSGLHQETAGFVAIKQIQLSALPKEQLQNIMVLTIISKMPLFF